MKMTPEKINQVIATELMGWEDCKDSYGIETRYRGTPSEVSVRVPVPNYYTDLNAVHEAALKLSPADWYDYTRALRKIVKRDCGNKKEFCYIDEQYCIADIWFYEATAPQRCEAILKTIGKWEE